MTYISPHLSVTLQCLLYRANKSQGEERSRTPCVGSNEAHDGGGGGRDGRQAGIGSLAPALRAGVHEKFKDFRVFLSMRKHGMDLYVVEDDFCRP